VYDDEGIVIHRFGAEASRLMAAGIRLSLPDVPTDNARQEVVGPLADVPFLSSGGIESPLNWWGGRKDELSALAAFFEAGETDVVLDC
jgi:hypothetical protein